MLSDHYNNNNNIYVQRKSNNITHRHTHIIYLDVLKDYITQFVNNMNIIIYFYNTIGWNCETGVYVRAGLVLVLDFILFFSFYLLHSSLKGVVDGGGSFFNESIP